MISEESVAKKLGLTRVALASIRKEMLLQGQDWLMDGRWVMITESGQDKLFNKLGINGAVQPVDSGRNGGEQDVAGLGLPVPDGSIPSEPVTLVVNSLRPPRNRRIIEAYNPNSPSGKTFRVQVRDNQNFVPGMEIRAKPHETYPDVYELIGRCPRYRGKW
jgi:hypothetical protein